MSKSVKPVVWVLSSELMAAAILILLAHLSANIDTISVLFGGLLFLVPNAYFTIYAFRFTSAQLMSFTVQLFYRGQMGKLILTAVGFALVFRFYPGIKAPLVFLIYGLMIGFHVLVARFVSNQFDQNERYQNR